MRYFVKLLLPALKRRYALIKPIKYAQLSKTKRRDLILSIKRQGSDIIYLQDIDNQPCVTRSKDETINLLEASLVPNDIIVVEKEIESWFLCGLSEKDKYRLIGKTDYIDYNNLSKGLFNDLIPTGMSRVEFMVHLLNCYNIGIAKQKNRSFKYFHDKWM